MSRYIDADALKEAVYRSGIDNQADISTLIEDQPTADAEEVVRCKDCKYAYINYFSAQNGVALCRFWANRSDGAIATMQQDDFCSYGERREK